MPRPFAFFLILCSFLITYSGKTQTRADKLILKELKGKQLKHLESSGMSYVAVKIKKKWGVYLVDVYEDEDFGDEVFAEEIIPPSFDSLGWFKDMEPFTVVKNKGKYGLLLNPFEISDAADQVVCRWEKVKPAEKDGYYYAIVKDGKWGLVDWFEGAMIVDPIFDTPGEVPLIRMESWEIEVMQHVKKKIRCDLVEFDYNNGDGAFRARDSETKKWGMYQSFGEGDPRVMIPPKYDSIYFFPWNSSFTAVFNDGKVGFYLSQWSYDEEAKQSVPCIYDDYQRYNDNGVKKLACKRDGKWGWVDWLTGEEKSDFTSEKKEDLPPPLYKQEQWFYE
jgi:hypothetical protein